MAIFTYTQKQKDTLDIFNDKSKTYYLVEGGSRSGKTFFICDYIIARARKYPGTRHLICRQSKTSCVATVWKQTLLDILSHDNYPEGTWIEDKTNSIINFPEWGGSSIWAGGFDNKQHEDAMLGSEWATIYVNEALDIAYNNFEKLTTRLQCKDVKLKLFADCNPKNPSHWLSKYFKRHIEPKTNEKLRQEVIDRIATVHFHPSDNKTNLSHEYLEQLESLQGLARKRFWDGLWAEDAEGLVYTSFNRPINILDNTIPLQETAETFTTWDFGTADPTFIIVAQILQVPKTNDNKKGLIINIVDEYTNKDKDPDHYYKWMVLRPWFKFKNMHHYCDPAGKIRGAKLDSWVSLLSGLGIYMQYTHVYSPEEAIDCANAIIPFVRVCEKQTPKSVEMFENWKYPLESDGTKKIGAKPNHDEFSHPGTAWYYGMCNRFGTKVSRCIV
jgi:PBSX family phage terminase large subunit